MSVEQLARWRPLRSVAPVAQCHALPAAPQSTRTPARSTTNSPFTLTRLQLTIVLAFAVLAVLFAFRPLNAQGNEPPVAPPAPPRAAATAAPAVTLPLEGEATRRVYLPTIVRQQPEPEVKGVSRSQATSLYQNEYLAFQRLSPGWTGNLDACNAGAITAQYSNALLRLVNYFRTMAGVPGVAFDATMSRKSQQAALMMAANGALSHSPASSWRCYSDDGNEAAARSNLSLYGGYGSDYVGILSQMAEQGDGLYFVGHRRWILYPQTRIMGNGLVPSQGDDLGSNVLYVFDMDNMWGPRPAVRDGYVAWPPPGFVPHQVLYDRWSWSWPDADFGSATVRMTLDGAPVGLTIEAQRTGYGENTLVWKPQINRAALADGRDHHLTVRVANVRAGGKTVGGEYDVWVFTP